jgi:Kinesin-associated protein (KAP)
LQVDDLHLKRRFSPYIEQCVLLLKDQQITADLFVEVLGTLANLCVPEFDFEALVERHDLLNFLAQFARPGVVDDDILLEIVMFVGARLVPLPAGLLVPFPLINQSMHLQVGMHVSGAKARGQG